MLNLNPIKKTTTHILVSGLALCFILNSVGCGQKGALVLPSQTLSASQNNAKQNHLISSSSRTKTAPNTAPTSIPNSNSNKNPKPSAASTSQK